jgi:hypothetical protein
VARRWFVVVLGAAAASACADDRAFSPTTTSTGSGSDGSSTTGSPSVETGSGDDEVTIGDSTGATSMDLPPHTNPCPESSEVALCIPPSRDAGAFCLCSRQSLGLGTVLAGDLDGDGLDDALVRSVRGEVTAYRSSGDALVELESVVWPAGVRPSTTALQYVPTLGLAAYSSLADGELVFGVYTLAAAPSTPTTLSIGVEDDLFTSHWFGDFDGDGALDLAVARAGFIDLATTLVQLHVYLDATTAPTGIELFSESVFAAIDSPQFEWFVDDVDSDGFDDVWFQPFEPGFPQLLWGSSGALAFPGQALPLAPVHSSYDREGDGTRELLGYGWNFGGFVVTEQTRARSFQPAVAVPPDRSIEIMGNHVRPLALGARKLALALVNDGTFGVPPLPARSALGVTEIDALPKIAPMRTVLLEDVTVHSFGTLDLDADGRDEVLVTLRNDAGEHPIHVCDVVER